MGDQPRIDPLAVARTEVAPVPRRDALRTELVWNFLDDDALCEEWAAIDRVGLSEPSTSLEWSRALVGSQLRESDTVFAVTIRASGELLAVIPAFIRRERARGLLTVAVLQPLSALHSTHSDIARARDDDDIIPALFSALSDLPSRWDVLRVRRLLEGNPVADQFAAHLARSDLAHSIRREQPSIFLDLNVTYEQFLAARSSKFRNHLRRKTRQLAALGRVEVRRAGHDLEVQQAYEAFLAVERRSWKQAAGTAVSASPKQQAFYRLLFDGAARRGRLRLTVMTLDERPIAYDLGILGGDRYSYLKTSFDESLRRVSPATVLRARTIEGLIAEGVRTIDFVGDRHPWEEQWSGDLRWHSSVQVFNRTPVGRLLRLVEGLRSVVREPDDPGSAGFVESRQDRSRADR